MLFATVAEAMCKCYVYKILCGFKMHKTEHRLHIRTQDFTSFPIKMSFEHASFESYESLEFRLRAVSTKG